MTLLGLIWIATLSHAETLKLSFSNAPQTLDWTGQTLVGNAGTVVNVSEGLFEIEYPSEKIVPAIAESLIKSKDFKTYTFKIRPNATWSDGKKILAVDFLEGWKRVLSPQSTSIYTQYFFNIKNAQEYHSGKLKSFDDVGISVNQDGSLTVQLVKPDPKWEYKTAFWPFFPVRTDLIEKHGANWWRAGILVSSGPFIFESFENQKKIILKRNPFYREKIKSNVDRIEISIKPNREEVIQDFKNGITHLISNFDESKEKNQNKLRPIPLLRNYVLMLNTERYPMSNRNFRMAILSAINRKELLDPQSKRYTLADSFIPPSLMKFKESLTFPFHLENAKDYLKKSAIVPSKEMRLIFPSGMGEPFATVSRKIADQIEKNLKIPVKVTPMDGNEFEAYSTLGEFHMMVVSWSAKIKTEKDFLNPFYTGFGTKTVSRFQSDEFIQAYDQNDMLKAQKIISAENAAANPLFFEKAFFMASERIENARFDSKGLPILKYVRFKK